jgi:prolyl oligopeptidase
MPPTAADARVAPPATRKAAVVDRYHGAQVEDDYRWLENWNDPEVRAWSEAQNAHARQVLDLLPAAAELRRELTAIRKLEVPNYRIATAAAGRLFALKTQPPQQQPILVALDSEDAPETEKVVVDPNQLDPGGATTIDFFVPSPDGRLVAVSLSQGGSEKGDVSVFESATGRRLADNVRHVYCATAVGSLAWDEDGGGFYYTRYPHPGERPPEDLLFYVQVYHHRLGDDQQADRYELGKDFPKISEFILERSRDGRHHLAKVQKGDSGLFRHYLRLPDGRWIELTDFGDQVFDVFFGSADELYLLSRAGAPRGKLLRASLAAVTSAGRLDLPAAETLVPESERVLESNYYHPMQPKALATGSRLYLIAGLGGPSQVRVYGTGGEDLGAIPLPQIGLIDQLASTGGAGTEGGDAILFRSTTFAEPAWYRYDPATGSAVKTRLSQRFPLDFGAYELVREEAVSRDGTRIPLSIVRRRGLRLDGSHPALLTGYGGFGFSLVPRFDPGVKVWLDRGGVLATANLRGGGEFGEAWTQAGRLTRKQNVFDDFFACAERLIETGHTSSKRLAIKGESNGGLLMGAVLTQRPELFRAVVAGVGLFDMLRTELDPNGVFNVPEYGSVQDAEQFHALYAYSPYHRVRDGLAYPAVLMYTGANDTRVNPAHSRKMTARLQAAGAPMVLLRTSATSGHGQGTSLDEQIELEADIWAFLFDQLGIPPAGAG